MSAIPVELATGLRDAHQREQRQLAAAQQQAPSDQLTPAEDRVLRLVATGHTNRAAAAALEVSVETVKTHLRHLRAKLDAFDRAHAVHLAHQRGWLP